MPPELTKGSVRRADSLHLAEVAREALHEHPRREITRDEPRPLGGVEGMLYALINSLPYVYMEIFL